MEISDNMNEEIIVLIGQTVITAVTLIILIWQMIELKKTYMINNLLLIGQSYIPTMSLVIEKPELGRCFKIFENKKFSDNEIAQKMYIHILICNFMNAYAAWKQGYEDENSWNAWKKFFKLWLEGRKFLDEWNTTKNVFAKDFVEMVDELINEDINE